MEPKSITTPPLEVKPSIKLARWTLLVAGIIYGIVKKRKFSAIENKLREEEERERPAREARMRCEKLRRNAAEMRELERAIFGTTSPDTEEEIPCNENVIPEDNSLESDNTNETVTSSDNNEAVSNE